MSDPKKVTSDLKQDEKMRTSAAAHEAFQYLNALQKTEYRGWGDTATAARDRAARKAGVSPAQAERVWKRWQSMKTVNGDVYRALRNRYEAMCQKIENASDAIDRAAGEIEDANADRKRIRSDGESHSTLD
jgi:hypothetical protein